MKIAPILQLLLLQLQTILSSSEGSSNANNLSGLDIATLRALGLSEDDVSSREDSSRYENGDEDVVQMTSLYDGLADIYEDEDEGRIRRGDEADEDDGAWWRNPLAQFSDNDEIEEEQDDGVTEDEKSATVASPILTSDEDIDDDIDGVDFEGNEEDNEEEEEEDNEEEEVDELPVEAKKRLAERLIIPKTNDKKIDSKTKGKGIAKDISLPLNILLPAVSIPGIRNAVSSIVGGSPLMGIMLSIVAAQYAIIHFTKSPTSNNKVITKPPQTVDSLSSALSESPNGVINTNMFGDSSSVFSENNASSVSEETANKTASIPFLSQVKRIFGKNEPSGPTVEDLTNELNSLKNVLQQNEMEKASLIRDNEDATNQVS